MISKQEASEQQATMDNPALLALLKHALGQFFIEAASRGFQAPLDIAIRDVDNDVLREFTIEPTGKIVMGRSDDPNQLFLLPLSIFASDANGRIARMKINAMQIIEPAEFLN